MIFLVGPWLPYYSLFISLTRSRELDRPMAYTLTSALTPSHAPSLSPACTCPRLPRTGNNDTKDGATINNADDRLFSTAGACVAHRCRSLLRPLAHYSALAHSAIQHTMTVHRHTDLLTHTDVHFLPPPTIRTRDTAHHLEHPQSH